MIDKKEQLKKELEIIEANERIHSLKEEFTYKLKQLDKIVDLLNNKDKLGNVKDINFVNYLKVTVYEYINSLQIEVNLLKYYLEKKIEE